MTKDKFILCIPAYNCEVQLKRVLEAFDEEIFQLVDEVTIIENKSLDRTLDIAKNFIKPSHSINVIAHTQNYGLGGSFKTAVKYAKSKSYENLIWFHGDDQVLYQDLLKAIKLQYQEDSDCIFSSRFMSGSKRINYPFIREYANRLFNLLFSIVLRRRVYDIGSGLNIYKVNSLPDSIENWPEHMAFDINLLLYFMKNKFKTTWMPITWVNRDQVSNAKNIEVGLQVLSMLFNYIRKNQLILENSSKNRTYAFYNYENHKSD